MPIATRVADRPQNGPLTTFMGFLQWRLRPPVTNRPSPKRVAKAVGVHSGPLAAQVAISQVDQGTVLSVPDLGGHRRYPGATP